MNKSPLAELLLDEMLERDWSLSDLVRRMGKEDYGVNYLAMEMFLGIDDPDLRLGPSLHGPVAKAFGVSEEMIRNMDKGTNVP